jgi:8-oxo-dGTP pyrophosphatase MutT (NUDIX family)
MPQVAADAMVRLIEQVSECVGAPRSVESLSLECGIEPAAGVAIARLLSALGPVSVSPVGAAGGTAEDLAVETVSPAAAFFLRSLAQYLAANRRILDNWERLGAAAGPVAQGSVPAGPQFLHMMESQRSTWPGDPEPLRTVEVAQVVIKARSRGRIAYLALYDGAARQFQLPGGHRRRTDANPRETAARELAEELDQFVYDPARDRLAELGRVEVTQLSRTLGVYTRYDMTLFQLRTDREHLYTSPNARWLTEEQLLRDEDPVFAFAGVRALARATQIPFTALPLSLDNAQRRSLWRICRDRPWESAGLAVGVLGVILSVIFYALS